MSLLFPIAGIPAARVAHCQYAPLVVTDAGCLFPRAQPMVHVTRTSSVAAAGVRVDAGGIARAGLPKGAPSCDRNWRTHWQIASPLVSMTRRSMLAAYPAEACWGNEDFVMNTGAISFVSSVLLTAVVSGAAAEQITAYRDGNTLLVQSGFTQAQDLVLRYDRIANEAAYSSRRGLPFRLRQGSPAPQRRRLSRIRRQRLRIPGRNHGSSSANWKSSPWYDGKGHWRCWSMRLQMPGISSG